MYREVQEQIQLNKTLDDSMRLVGCRIKPQSVLHPIVECVS